MNTDPNNLMDVGNAGEQTPSDTATDNNLGMQVLALVGDHSTVLLTRISCNTVFSKSQKTRKAGTLCIVSMI